MQEPLISVKNISYQYGDYAPILSDVSFEVAEGDYLGIVGPNGSGKTTLLKILLGLLPLRSGSVTLFGKNVDQFHDWEKVGYIPQDVFQGERNFPATVREVIESGLHIGPHHFAHLRKRDCAPLDQAIQTVNISSLLNRRIGELSGGERQRVFIARAIISRPQILILDEPTSGIDFAGEEAFFELLRELNEKHSITILLISHDLEALAHNAKTALCLNQGVIYYGPAEGLHSERVIESVFGPRAWHALHTNTYGH